MWGMTSEHQSWQIKNFMNKESCGYHIYKPSAYQGQFLSSLTGLTDPTLIDLPRLSVWAGGSWFIPFPRVLCYVKAISLVQLSPCPFPTTITITPWVLPPPIETLATVHTIIREELNIKNICAKFVARVLREDRCHEQGDGWTDQFRSRRMLWWLVMKAGSTAMTQRPRDRVPSRSMLALPEGQAEQIHPQTIAFFFWQPCYDLHALGSNTDSQQGIMLKRFRKRFHQKRPALFKSAQWHFHKENAPVHNSILVTDYLTNMGIKTVPQPPYSPDFAPSDFWLFPKLSGSRNETIEEMKEAVTKVIDTLTQEDFHGPSRRCWNGTSALQPEESTSNGTRVFCVYVFTVNKSDHTKKSGNLFNEPCILWNGRYVTPHMVLFSVLLPGFLLKNGLFSCCSHRAFSSKILLMSVVNATIDLFFHCYSVK